MGKRINLNLDPEAVASVQAKALDCGYRNISELFRAIASDEVALVPFRMLTLFQDPEKLARNVENLKALQEALAALRKELKIERYPSILKTE